MKRRRSAAQGGGRRTAAGKSKISRWRREPNIHLPLQHADVVVAAASAQTPEQTGTVNVLENGQMRPLAATAGPAAIKVRLGFLHPELHVDALQTL